MKIRPVGLWLHRNFLSLWLSETISLFGSQITLLALPLTAALILQATPLQMGILSATGSAAFLLVGLLAGVWVDRMRRRPILIAANLGRALLIGLVPLLVVLDLLRIEMLYVIALLVGVLTVFFDVAYASFLPAVVRREDLLDSNSKLELSRSLAQMLGPGVTGVLIGLLSAPLVIALDAISFLVSACLLSTLRVQEPVFAGQRRRIRAEISEGLQVVLRHPLLRATVLCTATYNLFNCVVSAVYILYVTRELGLSSTAIGTIFSVGSVGALLGSLGVRPLVQRFGVGPTMVWGIALNGVGGLLTPLATGSTVMAGLILAAAIFVQLLGVVLYNVNIISLRQAIIPERFLGRATACIRFCIWGTLPIGALIGGLLGQQLGLWPTIVVGALGQMTAFLWVFFSPLLHLRDQPQPLELPASMDEAPAAI